MKKKESIATEKGFYIGDPSYLIDGMWEKVGTLEDESVGSLSKVNVDGNNLVLVNVAYGIGNYVGDEGEYYPVEEGVIGVVPLEGLSKVQEELADAYGKLVIGKGNAEVTCVDGVCEVGFDVFGSKQEINLKINITQTADLDSNDDTWDLDLDIDFDDEELPEDEDIELDAEYDEDAEIDEASVFTAEELESAPRGVGWGYNPNTRPDLVGDEYDVYADEFEVDDWRG